MRYEAMLARNFNRAEPLKLGLAFVAGCFLFSLTFLSVTKLVGFRMNPVQSILVAEDFSNFRSSGSKAKLELKVQKEPLTSFVASDQHLAGGRGSNPQGEHPEPKDLNLASNHGKHNKTEFSSNFFVSEDSSLHKSMDINAIQDQVTSTSNQSDSKEQKVMPEKKPFCDFSDTRSDVCEMEGDIRIQGNSSSIYFMNPSNVSTPQRLKSWFIKPHPRKFDQTAMQHVSNLSVISLLKNKNSLGCTVNHTVPAVVFSVGGFMGNIFHDFTDVLIPLFITSRHYNGQVQFLITEAKTHVWWLSKYRPYLNELSHYEIIDFNNDNRVHCFKQTTIGLRGHIEMSIDPLRAPNGNSMVDFSRLMRKAYSLEREISIIARNNKPRLLIIARKRTRSFQNVDEIAQMAQGLGYDVVVAESDTGSNLAQFAKIVNSCDVMMGVHGAGLTNLVFLPTNAVVIQVVPLGGLDKIAWLDFGRASFDRKLGYLQYEISEEESSLIEIYPRDHPVFKDPWSIKRQGWVALSEIYLRKQNVRLDVKKFKGYLEQALQLLH